MIDDTLRDMKGTSLGVVRANAASKQLSLNCFSDGAWEILRDDVPVGLWEHDEAAHCFDLYVELAVRELARRLTISPSGTPADVPFHDGHLSPRGLPHRKFLPTSDHQNMTLKPGHDGKKWPSAQPRPDNAAQRDISALRVMIVEDHADTAFAIAVFLKMFGYETKIASNAAEALEAARREVFDVVLSDIGLPDGRGDALMRRLRGQFGLRGIAMTANVLEQDVPKLRAAGFCELIVKPIDIADLHTAIQRLTARRDPSGCE